MISRTTPCGLPLAERKARPTYSPSTPRIRNSTPATSRVVVIEEAQPDGVPLTIASVTTMTAPTSPNRPMPAPAKIASRSGRMEKLVARFIHSITSRLIV